VDDAVCGTLVCKDFGNYVVLDLIDQPAGEAAAAQMARDMAELCKQIAWDERVRVVVLSFHGGMDKEFQTGPYPIDVAERLSLAEPVAGLKQPVIAAIRGDALGPGLELALACDIRIGTQNSFFGLPQIRQGTMPADGGTQRLPRLVGQGKAMQMVLTGEPIDAEEACRLGLVQRIVPPASLMQTATEMARDMAEKSPLSLSYAKEALHKGLDLTLDQGIKMEMDLYLLLFSTTDRVEGITAFKEKRKPAFEGV
jgi:enoyl-CoA hydratase/carnithine racemase